MKISIITPTNNSAKTIVRNAKSVINQTVKKFEHIIVDNLSNDNTLQLVKETYQAAGLINCLKIITEKDFGISDAFNKGIKNSTGQLIGILNSDDYFSSDFVLENILKEFDDEKVLFVHGNIFFEDEIYGSNIRRPLLCSITKAMPYNHPTMYFRRSVYEQFGMFDTSFIHSMDFEFICRLEKQVPQFRERGKYFEGDTLVVMSSGGSSWKNELESVMEMKRALKLHDFWNFSAFLNYMSRIFRIRLKQIINIINFNSIIKIWRNQKWK